jgi:hypothetical protein
MGLIPSMAVETIVRNTLAGRAPPPGARPATRELELDDYRKAFIGRTIYCGERCDATRSDEPLYRRILGEAWTQLPQSLAGRGGWHLGGDRSSSRPKGASAFVSKSWFRSSDRSSTTRAT